MRLICAVSSRFSQPGRRLEKGGEFGYNREQIELNLYEEPDTFHLTPAKAGPLAKSMAATLDVWVVDGDGLPVEGVPFYCYHSNAPLLEGESTAGQDGTEWYDGGVLKTTDADGRISFPVEATVQACRGGDPLSGDVESGSGTPGACQRAIWPKGQGDVLENLVLMGGTSNRHLNGTWQRAQDDSSPEPEPISDPWMQVFDRLDQIERLVASLVEK